MDLNEYLRQVFRWSLFPKKEIRDRKEELRTHLEATIHALTERDFSEQEATIQAILDCGKPSTLRSQVTASAFGLSSMQIIFFTGLFAMLFVCFAATLPSIPLLSPSLMLCLAICTALLTQTRKRRDRWALLVALFPFCLAYLQFHSGLQRTIWINMLPIAQSSFLSSLLLPSWPLYTTPFFMLSLWSIGGLATLLCLGLLLYQWTRSSWSAALPFIFSISISLWPVARDSVKFTLWSVTHDRLFWNPPPLEAPNNVILWGVITRLVILACVIAITCQMTKRRNKLLVTT